MVKIYNSFGFNEAREVGLANVVLDKPAKSPDHKKNILSDQTENTKLGWNKIDISWIPMWRH